MKKFKVLFITGVLLLSINSSVYASDSIALTNDKEEVLLRTLDEYRWFYRKVNGKEQKRLWNLSRGEWEGNWKWV